MARELNIIVGRNFLVTAHKTPLSFGDKILERLKQSPEVASLNPGYALYIVLEELVGYYEGLIEHIDRETEQTEEKAPTETNFTGMGALRSMQAFVAMVVLLLLLPVATLLFIRWRKLI